MDNCQCQDTGTAIVMAKRRNVYTGVDDAEWFKRILIHIKRKPALFSAPANQYVRRKEFGSNLPAQIDIYSKKELRMNFCF
jgi:tartrate dehydratase alpha subunit/fumarate hydratase class I-like protein